MSEIEWHDQSISLLTLFGIFLVHQSDLNFEPNEELAVGHTELKVAGVARQSGYISAAGHGKLPLCGAPSLKG